ncbi:MAG: hypothetical protein WCY46_04510 [Tissierellaceae bacterium]
MMYITSINIKEEKKGKVRAVEEAYLQEGKGLVNDINSRGGEKEVSILTFEGREQIGDSKEGICMKRFYGNVEIKGLDVESLAIGQRLKIDNTILEITVIGKECFPECNLLKRGEICPLPTSVAFARVVEGGIIQIGNKVDIEEEAQK